MGNRSISPQPQVARSSIFWRQLGIANSDYLSNLLASFSKQPWAVKRLILGRFKFLIGCFNLWLPPELLGFIFIISDPIRVISIRFSSIFGVMGVLNGLEK
jgi:hypothetical protein